MQEYIKLFKYSSCSCYNFLTECNLLQTKDENFFFSSWFKLKNSNCLEIKNIFALINFVL